MGIILGAITVFCLLIATLFIKGYRHGMAVAVVRMGSRIPFLKRKSFTLQACIKRSWKI